MSLHALPGGRSGRPARSGQPWTDEDYDALVAMCREGLDLATMPDRLDRSEVAVLDRARRMLPVAERGLPRDRATTRLRELLRADDGYDWSAALAQGPPPRPVEHRVYRREGVEGLRTHELLAVAEALVLQPLCDERVRDEVLGLVRERGLDAELEQQVGAGLVRRARGLDDLYLDAPWKSGPGAVRSPSGREWERPWCGASCPEEDTEVVPQATPEWEDPPWW